MRNRLLIAACAIFLTAGAASAQVVVRIGPPHRPVERIPPPLPEHHDWV
jgi:hypothetical protein